MIEYRKWIYRRMLRDEPDKLFVFGDNLIRSGYGGQAKHMRGEPNAVGIPTKRFPSMQSNAFLYDQNFDEWLLTATPDYLRLNQYDGIIIWPLDGIGSGLARLEETSPKIWKQIGDWRNSL